jgi:hypothetical protein
VWLPRTCTVAELSDDERLNETVCDMDGVRIDTDIIDEAEGEPLCENVDDVDAEADMSFESVARVRLGECVFDKSSEMLLSDLESLKLEVNELVSDAPSFDRLSDSVVDGCQDDEALRVGDTVCVIVDQRPESIAYDLPDDH